MVDIVQDWVVLHWGADHVVRRQSLAVLSAGLGDVRRDYLEVGIVHTNHGHSRLL